MAKIILNTPGNYFLNSSNPTQFKKSLNALQLDPGAKIQLNIPSQHASTLTSFEYRVNGGPWTSVKCLSTTHHHFSRLWNLHNSGSLPAGVQRGVVDLHFCHFTFGLRPSNELARGSYSFLIMTRLRPSSFAL